MGDFFKSKFDNLSLLVLLFVMMGVLLHMSHDKVDADQIAQLAGASKSAADKVAVDLASVDKLINDYSAADVTAKPSLYNEVDNLLTVAQNDLNDIFILSSVKDAKRQNVIRAALAIGVTAIESIRAIALKKAGPTTASRVAHTITLGTVAGPKIQSPAQLKQLYNLTVADYPQAQLK